MDEATVYENSGIALTVKHFLLWFIAPYHSSLVHHTFYIYLPEMYIIKAINQDSSFKFQIQVYLKIKTCYKKILLYSNTFTGKSYISSVGRIL